MLEKVKLTASPEPYVIVPCTYEDGVEASYALSVLSDDPSFVEHIELGDLPQDRDLEKVAAHVCCSCCV